MLLLVVTSFNLEAVRAKGEDFNDVVKTIEKFYQVKHTSLPLLARAGIKTATTVARMAGGPKRQLS